jgi:acyl-ACP thioesterase
MPEAWQDGAVFYREFIFRFGDCDCNKSASLYALMKLFSEIAGEDYERRGLGYARLGERGQAVLISKLRLRVFRMPAHIEKTRTATWERGTRGPYFLRDFEMQAEDGTRLITACSQWFLVDVLSREVLRPAALTGGNRQLDSRRADCPECEKLKLREAMPLLGRRPVYFSDLDANGHVNNAVYGRIAVDFLPEAYRQRALKGASLVFTRETRPGETLGIYGLESEKGYLLQGSANGGKHFACEMLY